MPGWICMLTAVLPVAGGGTAAGQARAFVRVSPRDARYFELTDGRPYVPVGLNMVQPPGGADPAKRWAEMARWMRALSAGGGNYIRVWLGADYWDVEPARSGVYDEAKARRIDRMLALARREGIRVKVTLEHFRAFFGNKPWANKPLHHVSRGGPAKDIADFFDGQASRRQFRAKLEWFARRFGDRPEVFAWELWNEVDCIRAGDWSAWTETMLPELRRLFPRNLVTQSLGSFDNAAKAARYRRLATMRGNDIAQVHRYLDLGARLEVCHGPVDVLAADAVRSLLTFRPGRPVLLAESGAVEPGHSGPFRLYAKDTDGMLLHDVLFAPFFAGAAGAGQIWHWGQYVDRNGLWWHFGRFARAIEGIDPPAEGFRPVMVRHPRLRVYALLGRGTVLAWCRDGRNTWRTELAEGTPPETVRGAKVDFSPALAIPEGTTCRTYDPWTDRNREARRCGSTVALPDFRRSIVVRLEMPGEK